MLANTEETSVMKIMCSDHPSCEQACDEGKLHFCTGKQLHVRPKVYINATVTTSIGTLLPHLLEHFLVAQEINQVG
jgi:hypothetical protein